MSFTRFVPLPENRAALLAVHALARRLLATGRRGRAAPLTLHGPPGVGKSFLIGVLIEELTRRKPEFTARVVPATELGTAEFDRAGAAACDLLAVDDLQYLRPHGAAQLAGLLDERLPRGRPVVCTANVGPAELLDARLGSRLSSGLVVSLEPLTPPGRRALLGKWATTRKLPARPEVLDWLAAEPGSGRELLGRLNRLAALTQGRPFPLELADVRAALAEPTDEDGPAPLDRLVELVTAEFRVSKKQLLGQSRQAHFAWPRQIAMALAHEKLGLSLPAVGRYFGGRDHTTVLHACRKVAAARAADPETAGLLRQLAGRVK